jgi:hypothetical protein
MRYKLNVPNINCETEVYQMILQQHMDKMKTNIMLSRKWNITVGMKLQLISILEAFLLKLCEQLVENMESCDWYK